MRLWGNGKRYRSRFLTYCMAFAAIFITLAMVQYPKDAFEAAIVGLNLWWHVVFPSLLPFFILSEILMGLGVVHFVGVLLEPLMRPVFNVPGVGAFALSMGLASGYPMDAVITGNFRKNRLCTAAEAERLLSFTNTADPLFMFGAVAVGMFGMPELGVIIALAHYLSSFLVGFVFRFHRYKDVSDQVVTSQTASVHIIRRAFRALYNARQQDRRSLGQLLGDSVKSSMNTILLIGGFIIAFSVLIRFTAIMGLTHVLTSAFSALLCFIGFHVNLAPALVNGLMEIDLGTLAASQADAPLTEKVAVASAIIAWSGLCVHGQVASIVIESGIRMKPYIFGRLLHAVFAAVITVILMEPGVHLPSFIGVPVLYVPGNIHPLVFWLTRLEQLSWQLVLFFALLLTISLIMYIVRLARQYIKN